VPVTTEVVVTKVERIVEVRATASSGVPSVVEMLDRLTLEPPRHPLDEQVEVVGETYLIKGIKKVFREHKRPIGAAGVTLEDVQCVLVPEPWNPHDIKAVAVMVGRNHVGYQEAALAADYSKALNRLAGEGFLVTGEARIWAQSDAGVVRARVTILIPEADELS